MRPPPNGYGGGASYPFGGFPSVPPRANGPPPPHGGRDPRDRGPPDRRRRGKGGKGHFGDDDVRGRVGRYGNYRNYYRGRYEGMTENKDPRINKLMELNKDWFEKKDCMDIGW